MPGGGSPLEALALVFRSSGPNRLTLGGDLLLTDSRDWLMRAEALPSNVRNLRAIPVLFVIIIWKKTQTTQQQTREEMLVVNPDIHNVTIAAGFFLHRELSLQQGLSDMSSSAVTLTSVVSPTAHLQHHEGYPRTLLPFSAPSALLKDGSKESSCLPGTKF